MQSKIVFKSRSRRYLDISKRDIYAINALDRAKIKVILVNLDILCAVVRAAKKRTKIKAQTLKLIAEQYRSLLQVLVIDMPIREIRNGIQYDTMTFPMMETKINSLGISCSERFRFQSFDQLRELLR